VDGCFNTDNDENHCGDCHTVCEMDEICDDGDCE
jgi:hypothetical protein